jgi:hypothetical protein
MPDQELTIILSGKADVLTPESVVIAIENVTSLLKSIDSKMWNVGKPRYRWRITEVSMRSPFTLRMRADLILPDAPHADVTGALFSGMKSLDATKPAQKLPRFFDQSDLVAAKNLVGVYRDSIADIQLVAPKHDPFSPTTRIASSVDHLIQRPKLQPLDAYGSIDGFLRRVTIDQRPGHERSELQIIDRHTDQVVDCEVTPAKAAELSPYVGKRVILYGTIRYTANHVPTRIAVDSYEAIDESNLPKLADLHKLGISITGGEDAADFVEGLRGHGE